MEMEILYVRDPLPETLDEDGKISREKPSRATLAWRRTMWVRRKIAKVISEFYWDGKSTWWIDGILTETVR